MWDAGGQTSIQERFEEMKRYVRFDEQDAAALRRLHAIAQPSFHAMAREFYERAREHAGAHAVFVDEAQIARLHAAQVVWLDRMLRGPYDDSYAERAARIGRAHVMVGLPQRYVFSAMSLFRTRLLRVAQENFGVDALEVCGALSRILDIELALLNEAYRERYLDRIQRAKTTLPPGGLERRYRTAVDLADAMIIGLDAQAEVQLFNAEAERISGFGGDEMRGRSFCSTFLDADDELWGLIRGMLAQSGEVASVAVNFFLRARTGKRREIAGKLRRVPAANDDDVVILVVGRDVTDDKAMQVRLRRSEKLAAVGTLAAGLAHEIRNPLNGAQLHLTFIERALRREGVDSEVREAVDMVSGEIQRLSALVSDFLDFARPRELMRRTVSVKTLCAQSIEMLRPEAHAAGIDLVLQLPDKDIAADLDPSKVEQVLLNLLSNGVQAVAMGGRSSGGRVTLRAMRRPRDVVLEVEDDGPGLPDADAPIFDAFYSSKEKGTGLGLAIVHRIVTDHNGTVGVESRPGRSIFQVVLPLSDPEMPPRSISIVPPAPVSEESKS